MSYKILTQNGVKNTNIDEARNYHFNAGCKSGIVKEALGEGHITLGSTNTIALAPCELRLCGHRIIVDEVEYITFSNPPAQNIRYSLVAEIQVLEGNPYFRLLYQLASTELIQENLSADLLGNGTYQMELGKFTLNTDGTISDIVKTADIITGGTSNSGSINIGNVISNTLETGMEAEVDIEERYDIETKKNYIDFAFSLPRGIQGEQGPKGDKGDTGEQGPVGATFTISGTTLTITTEA